MRYDNPELRDKLAGHYVLGLMPRLAKARFERLMAADAALAREVTAWAERLQPIAETTEPVAPPRSVWRAIERRTRAAGLPVPAPGIVAALTRSLAFWRLATAGFAAAAAALVLYVAFQPTRAPEIVAVLADSAGTPAFIATQGGRPQQIAVTAVRTQPLDADKSLELWAISGGTPRPLGLVSPAPGNVLLASASTLADGGTVLAISLEPAGGSPASGPTGPVLYQGRILAPRR